MISIDWGTRVINVPKAYTVLVQVSPEIRSMSINTFRLDLKDLEDSEEGMAFPITHNHNTEVVLGGITYARVIEIINGYTITFEDGQYAVNLLGANSNIGDVVNVNQVSVRVSNSAGLISSKATEHSSFNGFVFVDYTSSNSGTMYPVGTELAPVNNWIDATSIANFRGFKKYHFKGNQVIMSETISGIDILGDGLIHSVTIIGPSASVSNVKIIETMIIGTVSGISHIERSLVNDVTAGGLIYQCGLSSVRLNGDLNILETYTFNETSSIANVSVGTYSLTIRDYYGVIKLSNCSTGSHTIALSSGTVILDNSITGGTMSIRGIGKLCDTNDNEIKSGNWNGATIINELISGPLSPEILTLLGQIKSLTIAQM